MSDYMEYTDHYKKAWERAVQNVAKQYIRQMSFETYHAILYSLTEIESITSLNAKLAKAIEALQFYAEESDDPLVAREALKEIGTESGQ